MDMFVHQFDSSLRQMIQSWPDGLHVVMDALSTIGQPTVMLVVLVVIAACGFFGRNGRLVLATTCAGVVIAAGFVLKYLIERTRPDGALVSYPTLDPHSFPSGHALSALIVLGLCAYLAWHGLPRVWNAVVAAVLALCALLIGVSRIYLGVHYPTDVVAGWMLALCGLAVIVYVIRPRACRRQK